MFGAGDLHRFEMIGASARCQKQKWDTPPAVGFDQPALPD